MLLLGGPAAVASPTHAPKPAVQSLGVSKSRLGDAGGEVKLSAKVRHAAKCTFSSRPSIRGLPARVSCASGKADKTVRLPRNNSTQVKEYRFEVAATGVGGKATRYATVEVLPAAPAIVELTASPDGLDKSGGSTTVTGIVSGATRCELSVTPSVAGLPVSVPCETASGAAQVTQPVTLPGLTGSTPQRYTFDLTATGPGGATSRSATETVWPAMSFSSPVTAGVGSATAVSCPTASFCVATDTAGGVTMFDGTGWTVQAAFTPPGVPLVSVSCTSATFCMAVDSGDGEYGSGTYLWNGKYWAAGGLPGNYLDSVSCISDTFCMALGNLNTGVFASSWNGHSWGTQTEVDSPAASVQVSCASPQFCAAVDANGDAMTFSGSSWSQPDPIDPGVVEPLATVSCPAASFCTAMDGFGQAFTYTTAGWSKAVGVENSAGVTSVSCTSASFCVAADLSGNVVTEYDGTWSAPVNVDPQSDSNYYGFTGISCASVAFCAAVDDLGNYSLGTG
jgi:hypothetical protein